MLCAAGFQIEMRIILDNYIQDQWTMHGLLITVKCYGISVFHICSNFVYCYATNEN